MKNMQKFISLWLTLCLVLSLVPVPVFAEETVSETMPTEAVVVETTSETDETAVPAEETTVPEVTEAVTVETTETEPEAMQSVAEETTIQTEEQIPDAEESNPAEEDEDISTIQLENVVLQVSQAAMMSNAEYVSEEEAVLQLRENLKQRNPEFTIYVQTTDFDAESFWNSLYEQAIAHTGNPTEGDYILYHLHGFSVNFNWINNDGVDYVEMNHVVSYFSSSAQEAELDAAYNSVMEELALSGKTDYQKVCAIYHYITENITYDYANKEDDSYLVKQTAYGALVDKTCVCQGYANLFYRMALDAGLDCRIITGQSNGENHAWNIVCIDGSYYNVDSTWDAENVQAGGSFQYFLKNNKSFSDHTRAEEFLTNAFTAQYPISEVSYDMKNDWLGYAADSFSGGDGSESAPFLISTAEELALMAYNINHNVNGAETGHYQLTADLDLSAYEWTPIKQFSGTFDGQGHIISNLTMRQAMLEDYSYGFIMVAEDATIQDIRFTNGVLEILDAIDFGPFVASCALLVGTGNSCTIQNCQIDGSVITKGVNNVAVLIGYSFNGLTVENVCIEAELSASSNKSSFVGGIIGLLSDSNSRITKSSFKGSIKAVSDNYVDGVNGYAVGIGGLIGGQYFGQLTAKDCYAVVTADIETTGGPALGGAIGRINTVLDGDVTSLENVYAVAVMNNEWSNVRDSFCGLLNIGEEGVNPISKNAYIGQANAKSFIKNCCYFAHDTVHVLHDLNASGPVALLEDTYQLSESTICDVFTKMLGFSSDIWTIADGYYPCFASEKKVAIPESFDHTYQDGMCTFCDAVDTTLSVGGTWGDNLTWNISSGTLLISGYGDMAENYPTYPWSQYSYKHLVIEEGIERISSYAFHGAKNLESVSLPTSVNYIGTSAFRDCISLQDIRIPCNANSDDPTQVFYGCTALRSIEVDPNNPYFSSMDGILYSKDKKTLVMVPRGYRGEVTIPEGVEVIGSDAMEQCVYISAVIFPDSVVSIKNRAFYMTQIPFIELPNSLRDISDFAFSNSNALEEIVIPDSVQSIGIGAFESSDNLSNVKLGDGLTTLGKEAFRYTDISEITIPQGVSVIPDRLFESCSELKKITLYEGITSIGEQAFSKCSNLKDIFYEGDEASWGNIQIGNGNETLSTATIHHNAVVHRHFFDNNVDGTCNVCSVNRETVETRQVTHMFRMYNPNTGEHFYTGSEVERQNLVNVGWNYEGVGFTFPANTGAPVHRLFQPSTGEHLYTMDETEKSKLEAEGWNYEGIAFNSAYDTEAVQHRLHNPNATVGAYHFTFSLEEKQNLIDAGWEYQGIGWYSCWK